MLLRCWCESSERNNKIINVLRVQIQNTFRKNKAYRKTSWYNIFTIYIELTKSFSLAIAIYSPCHEYDPKRDVLSWSPLMNLFLHHDFSRIPTAYTQACFAISCHAYRFMYIILQTWSWLKSNNLTILVMGNNGIVQCKLTFVQASCFINGISDNNSIIVWKTIFFLQTCATREYDVIKMLVLTGDFPRAPFENRFVYFCFLLTSKQDVG